MIDGLEAWLGDFVVGAVGWFESLWGMSFNETLLVLGVLLLLLDLFVFWNILTAFAYAIWAYLIVRQVEVHFLWACIFYICAWSGLVAVHVLVVRKAAVAFMNRVLAPTRVQVGAEAIVGERGRVVEIDGTLMVRVLGDLWPMQPGTTVAEGTAVIVVGFRNKYAMVKKIK